MKLKNLMVAVRANFLLLAVVLGFLGTSLAWYEHQEYGSSFSLGYAFIAGVGLVLAHISVNVFNDYFDFRSKLDYKTPRTPFSGGSKAIVDGLITVKQALWLAIGSLVIAAAVGIFFTLTQGWFLLPLLLVSVVIILIYTPFILRLGYPEWAAGLGLGTLPILGAYFIQTGEYTITALIAAVPSGILVHNLLLLNEIPDAEADKTVKRRTLPIVAGKKNAAIVYSVLMLIMYLWIIGAVITHDMPAFTLLGLLTLPLAYKAINGSFKFNDMSKLVPALANNVFVVLLTQLLMGVGFILAGAF
ncbi:MAG: prenyltransferase [Dehalococcoidales bacterium]|nr:prenyltransferase [Dehalococcoidales bacterium]